MNAPLPDDAPTRIGNRYRLDERIGAGAMGAVWRGTDELLNRTVAVKELLAVAVPPNGSGDAVEESRQRILREGRIGARLQHPHVISMFDVVVHDERPWLVMEYLPSKSLAAVLSGDGPMEPRAAAEVGRQVADGLVAAHAAGVVHRDVKPGNVLIAEDGLVKLTDFGVSRAVDDVQLTRTGLITGTPAFLAPEVARGQEPKAASDVFALGATLYAAVEGTPPFGLDDNAYALLHKVATGTIRPPEQAGPLTAVLMRLLDNDPDRRPVAAQARDALAAVVAGCDRTAASAVLASAPAAGRFPAVGRGSAAALDDAGAGALGTGLAGDDRPGATPAAPPAVTPVGPAASGSGPSTTSGPSTVSDLPAPRPPRPRWFGRRGSRILLVAGVVVAAGTGATAVALRSGDDTAEPPPAASSQVPVAPPAAPPPTSEAAPSTTPPAEPTPEPTTETPPTTADPAPEPNPDAPAVTDPVSFVQSYYALLPGNVDAAWLRLSAQAQTDSGGRGGFDRFYAAMSSVSLENIQAAGENTVDATVVFVPNDGRPTTREPYRFVVGTNDQGQTIIQSFSQL